MRLNRGLTFRSTSPNGSLSQQKGQRVRGPSPPRKQGPAPAAIRLFSFHDLLTSSQGIPAWPRQEIPATCHGPAWMECALERAIREREAMQAAGSSQSRSPHGPPLACPPSPQPKASGSPVLTGRLCTGSFHAGHWGTRAPSAGGTAPRHSLAGRGEGAGVERQELRLGDGRSRPSSE